MEYVETLHKVNNDVHPKILSDETKQFEDSEKNIIRSVSVFYSKGLVCNEKYKSIRQRWMYELKKPRSKKRAKRLKIRKKINIPSPLIYQDLLKFMHSIDIGTIHDVKLDFCTDLDDDEKVEGNHRELGNILLNLAKLYFKLEKIGTVTLNWFNDPTVFRVGIGADSAPFGKDDKATAFLLSFLNLEGRVASCNDNHLILAATCHCRKSAP